MLVIFLSAMKRYWHKKYDNTLFVFTRKALLRTAVLLSVKVSSEIVYNIYNEDVTLQTLQYGRMGQ